MPKLKKPESYDSICSQSYPLKNLLICANKKHPRNEWGLKGLNTLTFKQLQDACRYLLHSTRLKLEPLAKFHMSGVALFFPISLASGVVIPFLQSTCMPYMIGVLVFTAIIAITASVFLGMLITTAKSSLKRHNGKRNNARAILKNVRLFARNEKMILKDLADKPVLHTIATSLIKAQPRVPIVVVTGSN